MSAICSSVSRRGRPRMLWRVVLTLEFMSVSWNSQEAGLGEGVNGVADDEMVEDANVDEGKSFLEPLRDELISLRRRGNARRVVVREDHRCGIVRQCLLDDFARMN